VCSVIGRPFCPVHTLCQGTCDKRQQLSRAVCYADQYAAAQGSISFVPCLEKLTFSQSNAQPVLKIGLFRNLKSFVALSETMMHRAGIEPARTALNYQEFKTELNGLRQPCS
jgi:hypothetical protein